MRQTAAFVALLVVGVFVAGGLAAREADCDSLALDGGRIFDADRAAGSYRESCRRDSISERTANGLAQATAEALFAQGGRQFLAIQRVRAGLSSQLRRVAVRQLVTDLVSFADAIHGWGEETERAGYAIARFRLGEDWGCVGFARHDVHVPGGGGFRTRIGGCYCRMGEMPIADERIDALLTELSW